MWKFHSDVLKNKIVSSIERKKEQIWLELIKDDPNDSFAYKKLGKLYLKNKDTDYGIKAMEHALKLDPSDKELEKYIEELRDK